MIKTYMIFVLRKGTNQWMPIGSLNSDTFTYATKAKAFDICNTMNSAHADANTGNQYKVFKITEETE